MVWPSDMEAYFGRPVVHHTTSMAMSMPTHMPAEMTGKTCVPKREKMCAAMMRFVCGKNQKRWIVLCGVMVGS
jgi:hypothetical protein